MKKKTILLQCELPERLNNDLILLALCYGCSVETVALAGALEIVKIGKPTLKRMNRKRLPKFKDEDQSKVIRNLRQYIFTKTPSNFFRDLLHKAERMLPPEKRSLPNKD